MSNKYQVKPLEQFETNLITLLDKGVEAIPSNINSDRLKMNALMAISQDEKLMAVAKNQPAVISQYVYNFIIQGLDMLNREAYIVPYGGKLTPVIDYRGEKKIAMQYSVKPIRHIASGVVYENDEYYFEEDTQHFKHKPNPFASKKERGDKIGAYCSIIYEDGTIQDVFVNREEIEQVRNVSPSSKSNYSPWNKWEESMWEKTVIRKAMNRYVNLDFRSPEQQLAYKDSSQDVQFNNQRKVDKPVEEVDVFDVEFEEVNEETGEVEEIVVEL